MMETITGFWYLMVLLPMQLEGLPAYHYGEAFGIYGTEIECKAEMRRAALHLKLPGKTRFGCIFKPAPQLI